MTYTPSTSGTPSRGSIRSPTVAIPNVPSLAGKVFYSQPISLDKNLGNYPQVYMGWPNKWTVGTGTGLPASMVYRLFDNSSLTGSSRKNYGQTCYLQ
jgi:hypothetical protein